MSMAEPYEHNLLEYRKLSLLPADQLVQRVLRAEYAADTLQAALVAAHHALTALSGLRAMDQTPGTVYDHALDNGADANGARDAVRDAIWRLDCGGVLATIEKALARWPERSTE